MGLQARASEFSGAATHPGAEAGESEEQGGTHGSAQGPRGALGKRGQRVTSQVCHETIRGQETHSLGWTVKDNSSAQSLVWDRRLPFHPLYLPSRLGQ
ncbi:Ewing'S Tumor-Associated Antigen 1 [Manis pentadactyla]|nr:Ewing'S Tumor-Associated Antigen 1 [Manis pentadactyla]